MSSNNRSSRSPSKTDQTNGTRPPQNGVSPGQQNGSEASRGRSMQRPTRSNQAVTDAYAGLLGGQMASGRERPANAGSSALAPTNGITPAANGPVQTARRDSPPNVPRRTPSPREDTLAVQRPRAGRFAIRPPETFMNLLLSERSGRTDARGTPARRPSSQTGRSASPRRSPPNVSNRDSSQNGSDNRNYRRR